MVVSGGWVFLISEAPLYWWRISVAGALAAVLVDVVVIVIPL